MRALAPPQSIQSRKPQSADVRQAHVWQRDGLSAAKERADRRAQNPQRRKGTREKSGAANTIRPKQEHRYVVALEIPRRQRGDFLQKLRRDVRRIRAIDLPRDRQQTALAEHL